MNDSPITSYPAEVQAKARELTDIWADRAPLTFTVSYAYDVENKPCTALIKVFGRPARIASAGELNTCLDVRIVSLVEEKKDERAKGAVIVDSTEPPLGNCVCGYPSWTEVDGVPMHLCCAVNGPDCEPCKIARALRKRR